MNVDSVLKCFLLVQSQREQCFYAWGDASNAGCGQHRAQPAMQDVNVSVLSSSPERFCNCSFHMYGSSPPSS